MSLKSIRDLPLAKKKVFLRLDFNVPLKETEQGSFEVEDDNRIQEALPTIRALIEKEAKIIIASHLGRPDGKKNPAYSLEPVARKLAELLKQDVTLADDCFGEGIELMVSSLKPGQILLLENLRFYPGEEANDPDFCRKLARLCDVYVTDAFGTAHRKHASTYGLPSMMPTKGMGILIEKEVQFLDRLLHSAERPFYAILGGSKVSDKIKTIESLMRRVQGIAIGGAMAHAFWAAQGDTVPAEAKQPKPVDIDAAKSVIKSAKERGIPLLVPADTNGGFDIGPKTIAKFCDFVKDAKTLFWNGPLGWFEKPEYASGTFQVAEFVSKLSAVKVVGGGDTVSAIKQSGFSHGFDHLSTGGGAVLEYLESERLPGIEILKTYHKQSETPQSVVGPSHEERLEAQHQAAAKKAEKKSNVVITSTPHLGSSPAAPTSVQPTVIKPVGTK